VAVGLRELEGVDHPGVEPARGVGRRAERPRERVGRRPADPVELRERVRVLLQELDRARAEVPVDPRGGGRGDAVLLEEQADRAQLAWASQERTAARSFARPMPGTSPSRCSGSASIAASTSGPWRSKSQAAPRLPTCLTEPR
jgi:hypothetical protein